MPTARAPEVTARRPRAALAASIAGVAVAGAMQVVRVASMAALVFAVGGPELRADGLALALTGTAVASLWIALRSSLTGAQASAQSISIAVMVVAVTAAAASVPPDAVHATVLSVVAASGAVTGLTLVVLGVTGAARLVRYLPHPVIAGVLAASGWILVDSAVAMMARSVDAGPLSGEAAMHWAPGVAIGVWLFALTRAVKHPLVVPGVLVASVAVFYGVAAVNGYGVAELMADGWLFGPLPEGPMWRLPPVDAWLATDPGVVAAQLPTLATVAFITALSALLFTSGMELERDVDADPGRELRETGLGNLLGAPFGGLAATVSPTSSRLAASMRARRRIDAALTPVVTVAVLAGGASVLARMPLAVLGGLLVYLGVMYLDEWLVRGSRRLSALDMVVVLVIVATVATFGLLPGVAMGLVVTVAMFVVVTARTDVVAAARSGRELRSRVTRSAAARERLWDEGERIAVFRLSGTVFFGTADRLTARAKERLALDPRPRTVVLDVRDAATFDATGAMAVMRIARAAERVGAQVVVAGARVEFEPDLDRALERCEDDLLVEAGLASDRPRFDDVVDELPGGADTWRALAPYFEEVRLEAGVPLVRQGDPGDCFWILADGRVTAALERDDGSRLRLETLVPGQVLGESGFVTEEPRSADLIVDEDSRLFRMDRARWRELARERPEAAIALRDLLLRLAADRVRHLSAALAAERA
jgi:SulP family sulfate permease